MNRTKKSMWSVRVLITLSILMALSGMAVMASDQPEDEPLLPNRFSGNVIFNGEDAPVGAVINAYIGGELRGSKVVETTGKYVGLGVTGDASDNDPEITFTVCGSVANETAVWYAGEPPRMLNLSVTGRACGDVDPNEGLDARDVAHLACHVAGISGYETLYGDGDVDPNEGLDARDVAHLACHVAGISGYETLHC